MNTTPNLYWIEARWPGRLAISARPRGGDWLDDEIRGWRAAGVDTVVSLLTPDETDELTLRDEAVLSAAHSIRFLSLPVPDLGVPASQVQAVDSIRALIEELERGRNIAIHCRQGIGRSGMIAAALLVTAGADPREAFRRISEVRGVPVPETDEQRNWVASLARSAIHS
jgi:protein-tyrosine phosphatase